MYRYAGRKAHVWFQLRPLCVPLDENAITMLSHLVLSKMGMIVISRFERRRLYRNISVLKKRFSHLQHESDSNVLRSERHRRARVENSIQGPFVFQVHRKSRCQKRSTDHADLLLTLCFPCLRRTSQSERCKSYLFLTYTSFYATPSINLFVSLLSQ